MTDREVEESIDLGALLAELEEGGEHHLETFPRASRDEITVYKAMGHVIEDMVAAEIPVRTARERGTGQTLRM